MAGKKKTESQAVKRLRNRLKKHLNELDSQMSEENLRKQAVAIRTILTRNSSSRLDLKDKSLRLFDKNTHSAKEAKATERLRELVKRDYFPQ